MSLPHSSATSPRCFQQMVLHRGQFKRPNQHKPNWVFSTGEKAAQGRDKYQGKQKGRKIKGQSLNKRKKKPQRARGAITLRASGGPQLVPSIATSKIAATAFFCPVPKSPHRLPMPKATLCYFCAWTQLWAVFTVSTLLEQPLSIRFISYRWKHTEGYSLWYEFSPRSRGKWDVLNLRGQLLIRMMFKILTFMLNVCIISTLPELYAAIDNKKWIKEV